MARNSLRIKLRERQQGRCCYCQVVLTPPSMTTKKIKPKPTSETLEHLERIIDGGGNHVDNMALACHRCNTGRGSVDWLTYTSYRRGEIA